jgi:hypothetical protein
MQSREGTRTLAGRYELTEQIARGGMGVVWRGEDTLLGRAVAVKEMSPPASTDSGERAQKRVLREARAAAALHHPGIVTVYDMLEEDGASFIVMELLDADSLHDEVAANGPLDEQRAIVVGRDIASALRAAHENGITHRDVKPRNVLLLDDGHVKLADFGISSIKDDPSLTATGEVIGSPAFMSGAGAGRARVGTHRPVGSRRDPVLRGGGSASVRGRGGDPDPPRRRARPSAADATRGLARAHRLGAPGEGSGRATRGGGPPPPVRRSRSGDDADRR